MHPNHTAFFSLFKLQNQDALSPFLKLLFLFNHFKTSCRSFAVYTSVYLGQWKSFSSLGYPGALLSFVFQRSVFCPRPVRPLFCVYFRWLRTEVLSHIYFLVYVLLKRARLTFIFKKIELGTPTEMSSSVGSRVTFLPLEEEMATHSSNPAWRIPWTEEPHKSGT